MTTREIDFSPYFNDDMAEEYAEELASEIASQYDFEPVLDTGTYVKRPGFFMKRIPGTTEFAVGAEGTRLKYNPEQVPDEDVEVLVEERLEEARQEFASWKGVSDSLEV